MRKISQLSRVDGVEEAEVEGREENADVDYAGLGWLAEEFRFHPTRSLQTPPSDILVPRKRASHISGTRTLNTHPSIFSSYSFLPHIRHGF